MKVVHLCSADVGGAGKAAVRLHRGLLASGVRSSMVVARRRTAEPGIREAPARRWKDRLRFALHPRDRWRLVSRRWERCLAAYPARPDGTDIFTDAESPFELGRLAEVREADVLHLHWVAGLLDYGRASRLLVAKKVVWTLHDMNPFTGGCHYAGDCERYRNSCGACPQLGSADEDDLSRRIWKSKSGALQGLDIRIVTPSRWLSGCAGRSAVLGRYPVDVIANGIPTEVFRPHPKDACRASLGIPAGAKVVLFGADYATHRKGFHFLLSAFGCLPRGVREGIVLVSFGPYTGEGLPPECRFVGLGPVADEDRLARVYAAADIFVIPSLEDNLPNTVLEAMACGVPVVGFDIGGIPDMVKDGVTGRLVKPRDVEGLAAAMVWACTCPAKSDLAEACRKAAEERYSVAVQAGMYEKLYRTLTGAVRANPSA